MKIIQENFLQLTLDYFPLVGVCNFGSLASCCLGALLDSLQCIFFMSGAGPELNLSYQVCLVVWGVSGFSLPGSARSWLCRVAARPSRPPAGSGGGGGTSRRPGTGPGGASATQVLFVNSLGNKIFNPTARQKYFSDLRNFLLCWEARQRPTGTVWRACLACQVMLYLWCKLSSNLGLRVQPVLHHGLLVYYTDLGRDQVSGVAGPGSFTVLLSQTWPTIEALKS